MAAAGDQPLEPVGQATFGAVRRYDVHTGVDLHCPEGTRVVAIEAGRVVAVLPFTGPLAESPWWLPTDGVLVEDPEGVWLYGEVEPLVSVGDEVAAGDPVGRVRRVLRSDKGTPTSMLHLERYVAGTREPVWWRHGEGRPPALLDPLARLFPREGSGS